MFWRRGCKTSATLFDLPSKQARLKELEEKMNAADFWNDQQSAKATVAELKRTKSRIDPVVAMLREVEDLRALLELADEEQGSARDEMLERRIRRWRSWSSAASRWSFRRCFPRPTTRAMRF